MIDHIIVEDLATKFPDPIRLTIQEVDSLTYDQALEVLRMARRMLAVQLLQQEYHEHMGDDCGDYLEAASTNWDRLWRGYFDHDGEPKDFVPYVREFLREHPFNWLGCDGDIRFDIFPENYWADYDEPSSTDPYDHANDRS